MKKFVYSLLAIAVLAAPLVLMRPADASDSKTVTQTAGSSYKQAVFAAGCFWCIEKDFEKVDGVIEAVSGYAGGHVENPSYKQVSRGGTGHKEVVQVTYDPKRISYAGLLKTFWTHHDPHDARGQFCDKGEQYKAAIFYGSDAEKKLAEQSRELVQDKVLGKAVTTGIQPLTKFYPAESYHQNYYKTNSSKYRYYRWRCGRDARVEKVWGKADLSALDALD